MKKNIKYIVTGVTTTKPENLPNGVSFVENVTTVPHQNLELVTMGSNEAVFFEDTEWADRGTRVGANFKGYGGDRKRYFTMDQAREIGEWLIEVADSHKPKLRKVVDQHGSTWYEVQPEWFIYASSRKEAEELSDGENRNEFGWDSFDKLKRQVTDLKVVSE